jgi:hypothetical protein
MAAHESSINIANASSVARPLKWSSFDSGPNNLYFDVNTVDASNLLILCFGHSTLINHWYIGMSDSRDTDALAQGPYSAGKRGPMKVSSTVVIDAQPQSKFKTTLGDSEVMAIFAIGPLETARFKDSDGYIKMCRGVMPAGGVSQSSDEQQVCAILLP